MKKTLCTIIACMTFLSLLAQENPLVGMWNMVGPDGQLTKGGKMFLPDGRMYGYGYNDDFTDISTWIMANYDIVNDSTYVEHVFFHTDITYQSIDLEMKFKVVPDPKAIISTYTYIQPNGSPREVTELWVKDTSANTQKFMERASQKWDSLHQQALKDNGRVPDEGETVEQRGEKLASFIQTSYQNNKMDEAYAALLARAELDPTNLRWQQELVLFCNALNIAPTPSITYAKRFLSLAEAQAASPTDSTLQMSVFALAKFYLMQNKFQEGYQLLRDHLAAEEASQSQPNPVTPVLYNMLSGALCPRLEKWDESYEYAMKSIKALEDSHIPNNLLLARDYSCAASAKMRLQAYPEALSLYENALKVLPTATPPAVSTKEHSEAMMVLCLHEIGTKEAKSRMKELLKDKVWAVHTENVQDSTHIAIGFKSNTTYYPLINEEANWTLNSLKPLIDLNDFTPGKEKDEEACKGRKVLMSENGDIISYTGNAQLHLQINLKPASPELKARLQKAFREAKKAKK